MANELLITGLGFIIMTLIMILNRLSHKTKELKSKLKSTEVLFGKYAEQFMAFSNLFPYAHENFKFLGMPVDGVQFNDNEIIFIEFKTGNAKLSEKQELIKKLVQGGRVKWMEIRIPPKD
jgi:predicted Holliday junction resolvase-like endonuclease